MSRKSYSGNKSVTRRAMSAGLGAAALAGFAPFNIVRAQTAALKVGVLLPRSGVQAGIGQDCQRGVDIAPGILKELGLPALEIMNGDTETKVEIARSRAEKLISDGAQVLVGAFDSGQSTAIAQVAEQKGIPYIVNIAAAPQITEQGYKFVFRNFPTAGMILGDAFANQKELFDAAGASPKTAVFMHINDTFGTAMKGGIGAVMPKFNLPYTLVDTIAYDPAARDLSVEVAKAKATGADALLMVSRLNDAILLTRELIKQRWSPMAILSMGPGWYEDQYLKTLGKLSDGPLSFVPWYDPNKPLSKKLEDAL
ncbi:MAG: ABC transporter substrate-binding protein, partial [Pseudolabrys sp.]